MLEDWKLLGQFSSWLCAHQDCICWPAGGKSGGEQLMLWTESSRDASSACSSALAWWPVHPNETFTPHCMPAEMASIQRLKASNVGKNVKQPELTGFGEEFWLFLIKWSLCLAYDSEVLFMCIYWRAAKMSPHKDIYECACKYSCELKTKNISGAHQQEIP